MRGLSSEMDVKLGALRALVRKARATDRGTLFTNEGVAKRLIALDMVARCAESVLEQWEQDQKERDASHGVY